MSTILVAMTLIIAIPMAAALFFNLVIALRRAAGFDALTAQFYHLPGRDDCVELELTVAPSVKRVTVERLILERPFAARVLAQAPEGFRERHPAPPPDYHAFEPDLSEFRRRRNTDPRALESEKRRQHTDLVNTWADMCENVVMWEGRTIIRRGDDCRVRVFLRTDVAASGHVTIIYSYRAGMLSTTGTVTAEYRPRLIALHG
jgi:hypothetical protein